MHFLVDLLRGKLTNQTWPKFVRLYSWVGHNSWTKATKPRFCEKVTLTEVQSLEVAWIGKRTFIGTTKIALYHYGPKRERKSSFSLLFQQYNASSVIYCSTHGPVVVFDLNETTSSSFNFCHFCKYNRSHCFAFEHI